MQKVITITTHTNIVSMNAEFKETEFPKLNEYLQSGYKVLQVIPVSTSSTESYMYSLTFVLEKVDKKVNY
jgi:hypothetical protein